MGGDDRGGVSWHVSVDAGWAGGAEPRRGVEVGPSRGAGAVGRAVGDAGRVGAWA